jgi:pimeloyl-ACP methyl ester carboxylesterase
MVDQHTVGGTRISAASHSVEIGGTRVAYQVAGHGEPLVLVHGLSGSARWWVRNLPALAAANRVYLLDLPGHGAMHGMRPRTPAEMAAWLRSWMNAAGLHRASFIGHSMGGLICIRLAARAPDVVSRLVLVAPAGIPNGRSMAGHLIPLLAAARHARPRFLPLLAHDATLAGPRTIWSAARSLLAEDARPDLPAIRAPTLLILGAADPLIPRQTGNILQAAIPDARIEVVPGAGHVVMYDQPDAFNGAVLTFFSGPRGDSRSRDG